MNSAENSAAAHRSATPIHPPRVLLFCALVLIWISLLVYPVLSNTYLPLFDLPNHIARLEILAHLEDPFFSRYYQYDPGIRANSTMDLFVVLSGWDGDIYALARWSIAFYLINFQLSALLLYRVLWGHWSLWPLVAGLVAYSGPFFWGFQNFIVAVPFAIYVLALWIWSTRFRISTRLLLLTGPVVAVYLLHSIGLAILALCVGGIEIQLLLEDGRRGFTKKFLSALALTLPFWAPVAHLATTLGTDFGHAGRSEYGGIISRIEAVISVTGTPAVDLHHWVEWANSAALLLLVLPVFLFPRFGPRLQVSPPARGMLISVTLAALLAPEWISGVWATHLRIPFVLFLLFVSVTRWRDLPAGYRHILVTAAGMMLLLRVLSFDAYARLHSDETAGLLALFEQLDEGVSLGISPASELALPSFQWRRLHLEKYAIVEKRAFVPALFRGTHSVTAIRKGARYAKSSNRSQRCADFYPGDTDQTFRKDFMLHIGKIPAEYIGNPLFQPVTANDIFSIFEACRTAR